MEVDGGQLGPFALDRIQQGTPERLGLDASLHEVVLGACGNRGHPEMLVVEAGEDDDRQRRIMLGDLAESVDAVRVGQVEVEKHAVGATDLQLLFRGIHRRRPDHADLGVRVRDQLLDQDRVGAVVLDQKHRERLQRRDAFCRRTLRRVIQQAHEQPRLSRKSPWPPRPLL
jgi:hypothetical protein